MSRRAPRPFGGPDYRVGTGFDPDLCLNIQDLGGDVYAAENGVKIRTAPTTSTDGYLCIVTVPAKTVRDRDFMLLTHSSDTAGTSGLGVPNNWNNTWQPLLKTNGLPLNDAATASYGVPVRMRMWWKWAKFDDFTTSHTYYVRNTMQGDHRLSMMIIPREAFATDPQWDSEFGNDPFSNGQLAENPPPPYIPVVMAVRIGNSGNQAAPAVTTTNRAGRYRNVGLAVQAVGYTYSSTYSFQRTGADNNAPPDGLWAYKSGSVGTPYNNHPDIGVWFSQHDVGVANVKLDGTPSFRMYNDAKAPNVNRFNDAYVSVSLNIINPYDYPAPTPGKTWADLVDTFDSSTDFSAKWLLGTNRDDQRLPSVDSGKLRLLGRNSLTHRVRADLTKKAFVVDIADYAAGSSGVNLNVCLTTDVYGFHQARITMLTNPTASGAVIAFQVVDDGYVSAPIGNPDGLVAQWDPVQTRYWRIREYLGVLYFEVSGDKIHWIGRTWAHQLMADQLACMRPFLYTLGDTADASIEAVNPPVEVDTRPIPYEGSWTFMGAPPALREKLHGRDVLVGIADEGSTDAVRRAQAITLTKRAYIVLAPENGEEIWPDCTHGCLVTPCAVPTGGKFVEAVISNNGTSTASVIMSGILWCARQGAKAINLSFGGGGDDPVFQAVFAYISANYDTEIFIAAGNSYAHSIALPAAYSTVYSNIHSVIAWNEVYNTRPSFSNHHELGSGCAPGDAVGGRNPDGSPTYWRGTSAASPHAMQLCARGQTNRSFTAGQIGAALNRGTRDTGQPASEQGGGAFDLAKAMTIAGDPTGIANLPSVAMPRFERGEYAEVSDKLNTMITAVERLGATCVVRYDGRLGTIGGGGTGTNATISSGVYGVIPWQSSDVDTYGGMWDGRSVVTVPFDGVYDVILCVRYGTNLNNDTSVQDSTGAYATGSRGAIILVNGTDLVANGIGLDRRAASTAFDGVTVLCTATVTLRADDYLFAQTWQTSGASIECCQGSYGGTWMSVSRVAPLAPTFEGSVQPVSNLTALATRFDQVTLAWTQPASGDVLAFLIRRLPGLTPPAGITDGAFVASLPKTATRYVEGNLNQETTYSYGVWARYPSGYSQRVAVTVTTSSKPTAPAPVTTVTSTRRTNGIISLSWVLPSNPDNNGVTRAGIQVRRNEGATPPVTQDGGVLIANLPADATGYADTNVASNGQLYAYSIFTYRAEQVYSGPATHVRSTAINTNLLGNLSYGSTVPDTMFAPPFQPYSDTPGPIQFPGVSELKTIASPIIVLLWFYVRRPALFKGLRFLRPKPNIGRIRGALYQAQSSGYNPQKLSPDVTFPTSAPYVKWEDAFLPNYIELTPNKMYGATVCFDYQLPRADFFYWEGGPNAQGYSPIRGFASRGLSDPTGLLVTPGMPSSSTPQTLGWPANTSGSQTLLIGLPADYTGPLPDDFGGLPTGVVGHGAFIDMTVNEIDKAGQG